MGDLLKTSLSIEVAGDPNSAMRVATEEAFSVIAAELTARFDSAISGAHWPWPDVTPRWGSRGGTSLKEAVTNWYGWLYGGPGQRPVSIAGSPRSIVDSGDLKQSRNFELNRAALTATWTWNVEYAAAVHEGAYIHPFQNSDKIIQLPGRPWTTAVLEGGTNAVGIPVYDVTNRLQSLLAEHLNT